MSLVMTVKREGCLKGAQLSKGFCRHAHACRAEQRSEPPWHRHRGIAMQLARGCFAAASCPALAFITASSTSQPDTSSKRVHTHHEALNLQGEVDADVR